MSAGASPSCHRARAGWHRDSQVTSPLQKLSKTIDRWRKHPLIHNCMHKNIHMICHDDQYNSFMVGQMYISGPCCITVTWCSFFVVSAYCLSENNQAEWWCYRFVATRSTTHFPAFNLDKFLQQSGQKSIVLLVVCPPSWFLFLYFSPTRPLCSNPPIAF